MIIVLAKKELERVPIICKTNQKSLFLRNSDSDTESTFSENMQLQIDSFHIPKYALENKESMPTSECYDKLDPPSD